MADNLLSNLATALAAAQGQMAHAAKDSKNTHFKNSYASLASVLDAIREPLSANGLAIVQHPSRTEAGLVCVETILLHKSGEFVSSVLSAKAAQDTPQGIGSTITYLRRYGLMAVVGVAADDDDGEAASRPAPRREIPPALQEAREQLLPTEDPLSEEAYSGALSAFFSSLTPALVDEYLATKGKPPVAPEKRRDVLSWLKGGGSIAIRNWRGA